MTVIDGTTDSVVATIPVGASPLGIGVDSTTHMVYVANFSDSTVSVINGAMNTVTTTVGVGKPPLLGVAVNPTNHTAYITNSEDDSVSVISPAVAPELTALSVTPLSGSIVQGATQAFAAVGTFADGSTGNITSEVTWTSSASGVVAISSDGVAIGASQGTV